MNPQRNHKQGLTMIELIVAFAISAVFFAALVGVIAPVYRTYQRTSDTSDAQMIASNVIDAIRTTASNAETLTTNGAAINVGPQIKYFAQDGRLKFSVEDGESKDVFDEKFYGGSTIELAAIQLDEGIISVEVTVRTREGGDPTVTGVISTTRRFLEGSESGAIVTPPPGPVDPDDPGGGGGTGGGESGGGGTVASNTLLNAVQYIEILWPHSYLVLDESLWDLFRNLGLLWINTPENMFDAYYLATGETMPTIAINQIVSKDRLDALLADGQISSAVHRTLTGTNTFSLAVYFGHQGAGLSDPYPIVYVTDTALGEFREHMNYSRYGNMYITYYGGSWYILKEAYSPENIAREFARKPQAQIAKLLNDRFIKL